MNEFDADFQEVLVENTAQAVHKRLQQLTNNRDRYKYRWVWELLQNASDAAGPKGTRVCISLKDGSLTFSHDGKPFTKKNVGHLIYHGSTKQGDDDAAGRFGTGFLTSHLISKRVWIRGQLEGGRRFAFELSREGSTPDELHKSMDRSRADFEKSLGSKLGKKPALSTLYEYPIDKAVLPDVEKAIDDLRHHAPLVLVFNPRLTAIQIDMNGESYEIAKGKVSALRDGFMIHPIGPSGAARGSHHVHIVSSPLDAEVTVAVPLRSDGNTLVVDVREDSPRLFTHFPLLGTESFSFPAIINSRNFEPTEDRDGIYLWTSTSDVTHSNERLVEQALGLFLKLAELAAEQCWESPDLLARLPPIVHADWLRIDEFRKLIHQKLLLPIRDRRLVIATSGEYLAPRKAKLPISSGNVSAKEVWQSAQCLAVYANSLPREDDIDSWAKITRDWATIMSCDVASLEETLTIDLVARKVSELGSLSALRNQLVGKVDEFAFLNVLFNRLQAASSTKLFDELALLPNQLGSFCKRSKLYCEDDIDEVLKDIAESIKLPGRAEFLATEITVTEIRNLLNDKHESELLSECVSELKRQSRVKETVRDEFLNVNADLLSWIVNKEEWDELDEFPVLSRDPSSVPDSVHRLGNEYELPLCPAYSWPVGAVRFVELFSPKLVMSEDYSGRVTEVCWQRLATEGFVHISPLIEVKEAIDCFLPDETVVLDDDENSVTSKVPVQVSQITSLQQSKQGLIERIRRNRERAILFVEFICTFALRTDIRAFEQSTVACDDDKPHKYYRANWLGPLATRSWVPSGKTSVKATAESLGQLLRGKTAILSQLADPLVKSWLSAMRIGIADLTLHTLAEEETTRILLMNSISDLARAAGGDVDRIRRLATEISESPDLLDEIEQHSKLRKTVKNNQLIGSHVEQLLTTALATTGLSVTRTGVGSDFEVDNDLIEDGQEQWIQIDGPRSFLIEIKSARSSKVGMTVTQAKKAVAERRRYLLCVVFVKDDELTEGAVRANAWFVTDIGDKLKIPLKDYQRFETTQNNVRGVTGDPLIEIDIGETQTRFRIATNLARVNGLSFDAMVNLMLRIADKPH